VVAEVVGELGGACAAADAAGLPRWLQLVDPGVGFAKLPPHNKALLQGGAIARMRHELGGRPIMVGVSRKRFLVPPLQQAWAPYNGESGASVEVGDRDWATAGVCCGLVEGGVDILRVHNVRGVKAAVAAYLDVFGSPHPPS
jgi:dihydropteroate synthase